MLITGFLDWVFGKVVLQSEKNESEKIINVLMKNQVQYRKLKIVKDGLMQLEIRLQDYKKAQSFLDKSGIKVYIISRKGLPFFIRRYSKRTGMVIGALLFSFLMWFSNLFVWEVRISGNTLLRDEEIEKQLSDAGFGVGTYLPSVDYYRLCNDFLKNTDEYSWVSVNVMGTTAYIEVRERRIKEEQPGFEASNIVAKYSGEVENVTVYSGNKVVEKGSVVKEGDLLVSGFLEKKYGFETVRSRGSVYAYITRTFDVSVPFQSEKKQYTGNEQKKIQLNLFGKTFDIYNSLKTEYENSDTTTDHERAVLFDTVRLPFILDITTCKEYTYDVVYLEQREAKEQAEKLLEEKLKNELDSSELLEVTYKEDITENEYKLSCEVYCLADIAEEKEIKLN